MTDAFIRAGCAEEWCTKMFLLLGFRYHLVLNPLPDEHNCTLRNGSHPSLGFSLVILMLASWEFTIEASIKLGLGRTHDTAVVHVPTVEQSLARQYRGFHLRHENNCQGRR